ncbi:hypothetical protein ACIB24_06805 [Spongisporangium articulatum]|uniref:Membrane protein involved in the export of O-antigen and teichoic acid n=1 Tax=Spongisporangium articulatum TaxID=3362603 RepID=A0ABW8AK72_9ACTN
MTQADAEPQAPPRGGRSLAGLLGRASWNVIDQVLSSLTNVVLGIVVAQKTSAEGYGAFGVAFLIFMILIGVARAIAGQTMGIRYSDKTPAQMRVAAARALGTIAALGVPAGLITLVVGIALGGQIGPPLIAVGLTMPFLLMQDAARMIFFADGRAKLAAVNDGLWAVIQFTVIGLLIAFDAAETWNLVLAWGGAAAVCVVVACVQMRVVPKPSAAAGWVSQHRDLIVYQLPQTLLTSGAMQGSVLIVGKIIGLAGVGAIRAATVLFGPLPIMQTAVMTFAVPEVSRRKGLAPRSLMLIGAAISVLLVAMNGVYLSILLLLPDGFGHALFQDSWEGGRSIILPMGMFYFAACACVGPAAVIIGRGHARKTFFLTMFEGALFIALMAAGAVLWGLEGAIWGQVVVQALEVPLWFWMMWQVAHLPFKEGRDDLDEAFEQAEEQAVTPTV